MIHGKSCGDVRGAAGAATARCFVPVRACACACACVRVFSVCAALCFTAFSDALWSGRNESCCVAVCRIQDLLVVSRGFSSVAAVVSAAVAVCVVVVLVVVGSWVCVAGWW